MLKKSIWTYKIFIKKFRKTADLIGAHLANIINDLSKNLFSDSENVASERAVFKGRGERTEIENYRIVSFPKFFWKILKNSVMNNLHHQWINSA